MKPHEHILAALDEWCRQTHGSYVHGEVTAEDVRAAYLYWRDFASKTQQKVEVPVITRTSAIASPPAMVETSRPRRRSQHDIRWGNTGDIE